MTSRHSVSILTPSLNQARWLPDNLGSVAAQTHPNLEHIVMDGGSTDETTSILEHATNITWRSESDRGQSHALNKAFELSSGDIIGWLNADDAYFVEDAVASAVAVFDAHPDVDVVYGHAALVSAENRLLQLLWVPNYHARLLRHYNFIAQPAAFIRRRALRDGFVDERYDSWMDRELWLRLARSGAFRRIERILAIDRHHAARKSYIRELAEADRQKLAQAYDIPWLPHHRAGHAVLRVAMRFAGVSLLCHGERPVVHLDRDGRWRLLLRQVAVKRSHMAPA